MLILECNYKFDSLFTIFVCVGTKPFGSHHRFTTQNCESMYMNFSVKFNMCLLEFFLKERERKNNHNFEGLRACKKFPTLLLNVWAYPLWELGVDFPSANGTIIVSISTSKNIVLILKRERDRVEKTGTIFKEQIAEWCYVTWKFLTQISSFFFQQTVLRPV